MKKFEIIFFTRVLYFFIYERKIILTNGFVKKTRKTPIEQIQKARVRRKDFIERMEKNENICNIKRSTNIFR